jgi:hypothetical protein
MKSLGFIDLNLPPTLDDVELSTVSDPFLSSKPAASWKQASRAGQANPLLLLCHAHLALSVDSSGDDSSQGTSAITEGA